MLTLPTRRKKARAIRFLLLDVDGVLTDGTIYVNHYGVEMLAFSVYDGHGIFLLKRAGIGVGWISGRTSAAVTHRAKEFGIEELHLGIIDKLPVYEQIRTRLALQDEQVCYVGDDLLDLPVMKRVGFSVATATAMPSVQAAADWVTTHRGGAGAVREVADFLLEVQPAPSPSAPPSAGSSKRPKK